MEKKEYVTPEIQVYEMEVQAALLAGTPDGYPGSLGSPFFDDDEEIVDF